MQSWKCQTCQPWFTRAASVQWLSLFYTFSWRWLQSLVSAFVESRMKPKISQHWHQPLSSELHLLGKQLIISYGASRLTSDPSRPTHCSEGPWSGWSEEPQLSGSVRWVILSTSNWGTGTDDMDKILYINIYAQYLAINTIWRVLLIFYLWIQWKVGIKNA